MKTLRESPPAPRVLTIVAELSRSAYLGSVMGQLLHTCWEKSRWRFFRHWLHCRFTRKMVEHILKTTSPKMCQKIMPKIVKKLRKSGSGGCFGRSGGLPGAMSSRLGRRSAKMHTRSRQIGPTWWHLGGQVGAKIFKKINRKNVKLLVVFRSSLGGENSTKITPKWKPKSTPRRFPRSLEAKVVKV